MVLQKREGEGVSIRDRGLKATKNVLLFLIIIFVFSFTCYAQDFFEVCQIGTVEEVKKLIAKGVDVNIRDEYKQTPLMIAAGLNPEPKIITVLLKEGAKIEARDMFGYTALPLAALHNPPENVRLLLKAGASTSVVDIDGTTVLMYFAESLSNPDLIANLIKSGIEVNARNEDKKQLSIMQVHMKILMYLTFSSKPEQISI
jgi:ankyrin repeat protein